MRLAVPISLAIGLAGCVMDPGSRYDPHVPPRTSGVETINPYKVDRIPDTAYEIWKRDKERNDRISGETGQDTYPPLFKGQREENARGDTQ